MPKNGASTTKTAACCQDDKLESCQKFLERGHAYMEVDSMHTATEFAKKKHSCVFIRRKAEYL